MRRLLLGTAVALAAAAWAAPAQAAPWCGTTATVDRPAVVGGPPIRVIYAIPSDGADASLQRAPLIWSDVETIDSWWRGQDPLRTPRFDLAAFSCGAQVDLTLLRVRSTSSELQPLEGRFDRIIDALEATGADERYTRYLIYFDGPIDDAYICGQGGGEFDQPGGIAIVYLGACYGVPSVTTAAHELLHAFGAVPEPGPPNACPDTTAHVCDAQEDILYPYASDLGMGSLLLDLNRDDYYAHRGSWPDLQDSAWLRWLDQQVALAVVVAGKGAVSSDVPGMACTSRCTTEWNATARVVLTAKPDTGQTFVGWSGACSGTGTCTVLLGSATSVVAQFAAVKTRLAVSVKGRGVVRSRPPGIVCGTACAFDFPSLSTVRLTATPVKGWRFARWAGACDGTRPACAVTMSRARTARAVFTKAA